MFDWNDEEITNIIWGKGEKNDDHIVPYPQEKHSSLYNDQTSKQWNEQSEGVNSNESKSEASKNLTEQGGPALLDNCSEVFENPPESEQGDIVDYDWANVGSFDDLDRIFSADKLWSSSKDVTGSPEKTFDSLKSTLDPFDISSNTPQDSMEYSKRDLEVNGTVPVFNSQLSAANLLLPDEHSNKENKRKKMLKTQAKSEEKTEVRELHDICTTWSTPGPQYAPTIRQPYPPFLLSQQRPFFPSPMYASMATQYPHMPILSQFHSSETNSLKLTPGNEVSPSTSDHASVKMSPREKIEKLRRRQQMRAMAAIQKQQRQFNNQISFDKPSLDNSDKVIIPSDDLSMEDSILFQLQEIIGKLDNGIRLCIRDSLFRLAQSSSQRKYTCDTSGSNDQVLNKEENNSLNRFGKMQDIETQTNPIDRTVAHLLFHRSLLPSGKHSESSELPLSMTQNSDKNTLCFDSSN